MAEGYGIHLFASVTLSTTCSEIQHFKLLSKSGATKQADSISGRYVMRMRQKQPHKPAGGHWLRPHRRRLAGGQQVFGGAVTAGPSRSSQSDLFRDTWSLPALATQLLCVLHRVCIRYGPRERITLPPA